MNIAGIGLPSIDLPSASLPTASPTSGDSSDVMNKNADEIATNFEGVFMSMILKEMRATLSDGLFSGEGSDTLGALFDLHMGQHMADRGGLGIGELVATEYKRNAT